MYLERHRQWAMVTVLAAAMGCSEPNTTEITSPPGVEKVEKEVPKPLPAVEKVLAAAEPTGKERAPERFEGTVPVPLISRVTMENGGTVNVSVTQTVEELRRFYVERGFEPVDHPEGFAVFMGDKGPIVQVLKGVGPRSEIVIIQELVDPNPPPERPATPRLTGSEILKIQERLRGDEPTEKLPQPPDWEK